MVTDVGGDRVAKSQEGTVGDFGAPQCSSVFGLRRYVTEATDD